MRGGGLLGTYPGVCVCVCVCVWGGHMRKPFDCITTHPLDGGMNFCEKQRLLPSAVVHNVEEGRCDQDNANAQGQGNDQPYIPRNVSI